jgi:ABC-type phosphate transport system substrate-binding protein
LLVWKNAPNAEKGQKWVGFLKWAVREGQAFAGDLHYAPLPSTLVPKIEAAIAGISTK